VQTFGQSAANGIPMPNIPQMGSVWGPLGDNLLLVRNGEI
jgi:maltose/maltodextrin transport system substrate-binding protein